MKINISDKAFDWYLDEMNLKPGEGIRFIGKVYGKTAVHEGMSLGIQKRVGLPESTSAMTERDGRYFWVGADDGWFFADYDLDVQWDDKFEEPRYDFTKNGIAQVDSKTGASATDAKTSASVHDEP